MQPPRQDNSYSATDTRVGEEVQQLPLLHWAESRTERLIVEARAP